jgi:hypothetical protein
MQVYHINIVMEGRLNCPLKRRATGEEMDGRMSGKTVQPMARKRGAEGGEAMVKRRRVKKRRI